MYYQMLLLLYVHSNSQVLTLRLNCSLVSIYQCVHSVVMLSMLTDRKKDLVKLQAGEYVSLGKVETSLKLCQLIDNLCLYADSSKMFTVCLVVPNRKNLEALAQRIGIGDDVLWPELCDHPAIEQEVLKQLQAHGLKCNWFFVSDIETSYWTSAANLRPRCICVRNTGSNILLKFLCSVVFLSHRMNNWT